MTWLGHRRLTIANRNSAEVTVILLLTNYDQDFNMDNVKVAAACRKAFMRKGVEELMLNTVCLKYLLSNLASLIQLQKNNEILEDRSLLASPFMKSLVALSEVFSLDKVFETSEILSVDTKSGKKHLMDLVINPELVKFSFFLADSSKSKQQENEESEKILCWRGRG